ncbi:MAG: hypothetical protein KDC74_07365 [Flavobacteriaceae bacterium]|jgi:hypothetical protein|nr:hypothetical protein [Flavobacteriaceae bacterium]
METTNYVEFKKERDLGAIINDTFKFIRENWKAYFNTIIKIAGPFILVGAIVMVFFLSSFSSFFKNVENSNPDEIGFDIFANMFSWMGILLLVGGLVFVIVSAASLYFIKSYIENRGTVDFNEVRTNTFKNFWNFLGLGILMMLVIILGMMLCYLPGIYLGVVLSLATSIMAFENKGIGDSFSHSFTLISGQWWATFGVLFVVYFLVSILGSVFSIPAFIYQMVKMATSFGENDPTAMMNLFSDPIYIALNVLSYVGKFILSAITLIATVFVYYDLNEQKNLTGTLEKIDSIGQ